MTDQLGIVAEQLAKRAGAVKGLSLGARHQAFPKVYAQPVPRATSDAQLQATLAKLQGEKAKLLLVNAELRAIITDQHRRLEEASALSAAVAPALMGAQQHPPAAVIGAFLSSLNAIRTAQGGEPLTASDLAAPCRARFYAAPRHVCMWLVRQLCTHYSLPMTGKLFGRRDHTTVMHAYARAPLWMLTYPDLKAAADATLAKFGALT